MGTRATVVGAALLALLAAAPRPDAALASLLAPARPGQPLTGPLVAVAALLAWALLAWLLLTVGLTAGGRLRGPLGAASRAALRRCAPAAVRQVVAVALGVGVVLAAAGPASAGPPARSALTATATATAPAAGTSAQDATTTGSWDWPSTPAPAAAPAAGGHGDADPSGRATVVVRPGDSLWRLAAERLPRGAPPAAVAADWPRWWSANRSLLGDDPDLLHPGQRLVVPDDPAAH